MAVQAQSDKVKFNANSFDWSKSCESSNPGLYNILIKIKWKFYLTWDLDVFGLVKLRWILTLGSIHKIFSCPIMAWWVKHVLVYTIGIRLTCKYSLFSIATLMYKRSLWYNWYILITSHYSKIRLMKWKVCIGGKWEGTTKIGLSKPVSHYIISKN